MAPDKKLEKSLKRALRNFHLSLDLYNSQLPDSQETTIQTNVVGENEQVNFEKWFRESLVEPYANKIPKTV